MNKTTTVIVIVIVAVLGIWFLASGIRVNAPTNTAPGDTNTGDVSGAAKELTVTGSNFSFSPNTLTVKKGDTVKITFKNSDGMHDFVIDEFNVRTSRIGTGAEETVTFVADKAGSFQYYCSVGTHRAMGMWGKLTVTE